MRAIACLEAVVQGINTSSVWSSQTACAGGLLKKMLQSRFSFASRQPESPYFWSPTPNDTDPLTPSGSGVEISKLKFGEDQVLVTVLPDS